MMAFSGQGIRWGVLGPKLAASLCVLLFSSMACAQSEISVRILNSPPRVLDIWANPAISANDSDIVWCLAVYEDMNRFSDVDPRFHIGKPSNDGLAHITEPHLVLRTEQTPIRGKALAGFVIEPDAPQGVWHCIINASDSSGEYDTAVANFNVMPKTCANDILDTGERGIDCGGPCMPCTCDNGILDTGERGIDCGGPCGICPALGSLSIEALPNFPQGGKVFGQVLLNGTATQSIVRIVGPCGQSIILASDADGLFSFLPENPGKWVIKADLYGISQAVKTIGVGDSESNQHPKIPWQPIVLLTLSYAIYRFYRAKRRKKPRRKLSLEI